MRWIGLIAAILLVIACCIPWVFISWRDFMATGIDAGEQFKRPGYGHFLFTLLFLVFTFTPRIWAKRVNLLVTALNMAWAIRNFSKLSACDGGQCPDKQAGIYLVLAASLLMLVTALFPHLKVKKEPAAGLQDSTG